MLWIRKYINQTPSFNYFETHISTIEKTVETNPALCIETCKSLVESICKTILANQNIEHDNYGQFQALVKQTINCLNSVSLPKTSRNKKYFRICVSRSRH